MVAYWQPSSSPYRVHLGDSMEQPMTSPDDKALLDPTCLIAFRAPPLTRWHREQLEAIRSGTGCADVAVQTSLDGGLSETGKGDA
jgi:hypothetical protein